MPNENADFLAILQVLSTNDVKFIVVGGVCAVLHGAPVTTFDVDVVYAMDDENIAAIETSLNSIGAYYRGRGNQRLYPKAKQLSGGGHHLFTTDLGPVDLLSFVGKNRDYDALLEQCENLTLETIELRILSLPALIEVKKETLREKDELHLRILERLWEEEQQDS